MDLTNAPLSEIFVLADRTVAAEAKVNSLDMELNSFRQASVLLQESLLEMIRDNKIEYEDASELAELFDVELIETKDIIITTRVRVVCPSGYDVDKFEDLLVWDPNFDMEIDGEIRGVTVEENR